jgi:uncharacterized protein (TIGR02271 family)
MDQQYQGLPVEGDSGPLGTVVGVDTDPATGATHLVVQGTDGSRRTLLSDMFTVRNNAVYVRDASAWASMGTLSQPRTVTQPLGTRDTVEVAAGEEITIPILREEVIIRTREVQSGGVRVHKLVNERTETVEQPTRREQIDVERVTVGRVIDDNNVPHARQEGDTLIIPILEEMLVVEKRLVLKEEVRITRRRTEDVEQIQVVLREEDVQIERLQGERGTFDTPGTATV